MANKQELVRFLDQHVFDPILKAKPDGRSDHERKQLEDVQQKTRTEQERYHHYPNASEVVQMYKDDLRSEHARKVNAELKRLGLPILADVKDEFFKMAG